MRNYSINRTNVTDVVEYVVNDVQDIREDVSRLTDVVEHLVVTFKKQLGSDAERLLDALDGIRAVPALDLDPMLNVTQHESNEIGAVYSDKRDSARVD